MRVAVGRAAACACAAGLAILGCRGSHAHDATVLAAASLGGPFGELASLYEREHPGARVALELAASSTLTAQVRAGARFDVLATADERTMALAWRAGLVESPELLATNQLVGIAAADETRVRGIEDLARPGIRVVLAQPEVPAGAYAREALAALGIADAVESNVVSNALDVKGVAAAVARGEADAGIVYVTDLTPELRARVRAVPLPAGIAPRARYPIARAAAPEHPRGARAFLVLARSESGRRILAEHGFGPP